MNNTDVITQDPVKTQISLQYEATEPPKTQLSTACSWLDDYIEFSRKASPSSYEGYHEGCGLWLLSTVASRRVAFPLSTDYHYTSLYIALLGRTGVYAKSTAAKVAKLVLEKAGLDYLLIPDRITPPALVQEMSQKIPEGYSKLNKDQQNRITRKLSTAGQRGWFHEEFGVAISGMMRSNNIASEFRSLLRILDDTPERYENSTVWRGSDVIEKPYLALLAIMTPADLAPYAQEHASLWNDGYLARFSFITPPDGTYSKGRFSKEILPVPDSILKPLQEWHKRLGIPVTSITKNDSDNYTLEIKESIEPSILSISQDAYDAFYDYRDMLGASLLQSSTQDLDGNLIRFSTKALRISALFASLANVSEIGMNHWSKAKEITERWRENLYELYRQVNQKGMTQKPSTNQRVLRAIQTKGPQTSRQIQQFTGLNAVETEKALQSLVSDGFLIANMDGKTVIYSLTEKKEGSMDKGETVEM